MKIRLSMPSTTSMTTRVAKRHPGGGIGEQNEKIVHGGSDHVVPRRGNSTFPFRSQSR